jgi:hypothetical protein
MSSNMDDIVGKLKLGKHYRMERFTLVFSLLSICLVLVMGFCVAADIRSHNVELGSKALYTTEFTTSRTNVTGEVENVYTSKDKTKAFVLMKFSDVDKMSTNADNYQAFLTGASAKGNQATLKSYPSGSIYVFGTTGYMGVYLVNTNGFPTQILDLTMRCDSELSETTDTTRVDDAKDDASFAKHDQFKVYFNPGASGATNIACLDSDKAPSKLDLYNQMVVDTEKKDIEKKLTTDLEMMRTNLNQIQEYTDRLKNTDGIQVPDTPAVIAGDSITQDPDTKKYTVKFKSVVDGGYDFDWQNTSIEKGWLDKLIAKTDSPTMTYDQYFAMQAKARKNSTQGNSIDTDIEWTFQDGTLLEDLNSDGNSTKYTSVNNDCQKLIAAWNTYYQNKTNYQTDDLESLLSLEATAKQVQESASVNTSKKVIQCY